MAVQDKHQFKMSFSFHNSPYTAFFTIIQKEDHDEYYVIPNDDLLLNKYGTQTIDNYFDQKNPFRSRHIGDDYIRSIITGIQEFLNSKHC